MRTARMLGAGAVLAAILLAPPAAAGAAPGVVPLRELVGPEGNFWCDTGEVFAGEPNNFGHAVITQRPGSVAAVVRIQGGAPDTTYAVRLIQITPNGEDCHRGESFVNTNAQGVATLRLSEAVLAEALGFNVAVNTGELFGHPHWVGQSMVPLR